MEPDTKQPPLVALRKDHLIEILATWTGVPPERLAVAGLPPAFFAELRQALSAEIFGQECALNTVMRALQRRYALPERPGGRRPLWTAFFAGPSGVGKTALAQALATRFCGDPSSLVQIDCSEFDQDHTLARLVGAPPGYVGYQRGGQLTNELRRLSHGILLFDEIDKAHPALLVSVLLPLLGEGIIHDMSTGAGLDASQFVVILTATVGGDAGRLDIPPAAGDTSDAFRHKVRTLITSRMPREILGRMDDIVVFAPLNREAFRTILAREVRHLEQRFAARGTPVTLRVDAQVANLLLAMRATELSREGARALLRIFDRVITDRCLALMNSWAGGIAHIDIAATPAGEFMFEVREGE